MIGDNATIVAVATPAGEGGLAVIRVSGMNAVNIVDSVWKGKRLTEVDSRHASLGYIVDEKGNSVDQAVAVVYRAPASFTGEDVVEISCHGSKWIQREIVNLLIRKDARMAGNGEFSQRAFLNGRLDLAQAEGIADLISASSRASHRLAMSQMRGDFSKQLGKVRDQLIDLASLLELELDFSEEDVEFANRSHLMSLADSVIDIVERLASSYSSGMAFKEGIPVVIAGMPNAGKSTLLNRLINEEKAIVSDIPGTTRDVIEDSAEIGGVQFRFYDTAGLRSTTDTVERIGIEKARNKISMAGIILWIIDPTHAIVSTDDNSLKNVVADGKNRTSRNVDTSDKKISLMNEEISDGDRSLRNDEISDGDRSLRNAEGQLDAVKSYELQPHQKSVIIFNKADLLNIPDDELLKAAKREGFDNALCISASDGRGTDEIERLLVEISKSEHNPENEIIVTNARHYEALIKGAESLKRMREAMGDGISADFIAQDLREAIHYLGEITGSVTTGTLLHTIFSRFCIGK